MPRGLKGEAIPLVARIVYVTSFLEVFHNIGGREASLQLARERRGKAFDPGVVDAFLALSERPEFWEGLEQESPWDAVLALEPDSPRRYISADRIPELASSFADFADLKAPHLLGHSRRTADLARRMAERLQRRRWRRCEWKANRQIDKGGATAIGRHAEAEWRRIY